MTLLKNLDDLDANGKVGDWTFSANDTHIFIILMEGDHGLCALPIQESSEYHVPHWKWNGSHESPTLEPSILHHSNPPWHGYMRNGKLETV